jgi:PAS domain S-box-containing protein
MMSNREEVPELPSNISRQTVRDLPISMVIADPHQDDCPIIYVNRAFTETTGYTAEQAIGRNCRFLQGADTREEDREAIRTALAEARDVTVDIANYRADGRKFVNRLTVTPLRSEAGDVIYFLGVLIERSAEAAEAARLAELDARLRELQHRVRNHLSMILGLIRIQAKRSPTEMVDLLAHRVRSLSLLYDEFVDHAAGTSGGRLDLGEYIGRIATTLHEIDGRAGIRLDLALDPVPVPVDDAGRIGLVLSEIVTNAFRHGFGERDSGRLAIELVREGARARLAVHDDGRGITPEEWPHPNSLGAKIVLELLEKMNGRLVVAELPTGEGAHVSLSFDVPEAAEGCLADDPEAGSRTGTA